MPRAAGDSEYYEISLMNGAGQPVGQPMKLPSVTSILKALPKWGLDWYGFKMGATEARRLMTDPALAVLDDDKFYEALKALGRDGKARTPTSALREAGDRGTDVHDIAERLLLTGKMPPKAQVPPEKIGYAEALWDWYVDNIQSGPWELVHAEMPVFSMVHRYAGTMDALLKNGDTYAVIDFKTSKAIYESHLLQGTAYEAACKEQLLIPPHGAASFATVVRLGNNGKFETATSGCVLDHFLQVYRVWQWLKFMKGEPVYASA